MSSQVTGARTDDMVTDRVTTDKDYWVLCKKSDPTQFFRALDVMDPLLTEQGHCQCDQGDNPAVTTWILGAERGCMAYCVDVVEYFKESFDFTLPIPANGFARNDIQMRRPTVEEWLFVLANGEMEEVASVQQ